MHQFRSRQCAIAIGVVCLLAFNGHAQDSAGTGSSHDQNTKTVATAQQVTELLNLMHADNVIHQMILQARKERPDLPAKFFEEFESPEHRQSFYDVMIPIYQKHLSAEDIRALAAFFRSPAGQHYIAEMPTMTVESVVAGQQWGRDVAEQVMRKLQSENNAQLEGTK